MKTIIDWLSANEQWLFNGLGVVVLVGITKISFGSIVKIFNYFCRSAHLYLFDRNHDVMIFDNFGNSTLIKKVKFKYA